MATQHIALLGDSIFDNGSYTAGAPDVIAHVRAGLPHGWRASLLAVDGSTTRDLASQVARIPADVTQIIVSIGGNDLWGDNWRNAPPRDPQAVIGGVIDHMHSGALLRDLDAGRAAGMMVTTPNEAALRADTLLMVGPGLETAWPELEAQLLATR